MKRALALGLALFALGHCSDGQDPGINIDSGPNDAVRSETNIREPDFFVAPDINTNLDLINDPGGPIIEILHPVEEFLNKNPIIKVRARISPSDATRVVDAQSVMLQVMQPAQAPVRMSLGAAQDEYEASIDLGNYDGSVLLKVSAKDQNGALSEKKRTFVQDAGPVIEFDSPEEGSSHKGSVTLQVKVRDPEGIKSFDVRVGSVSIPVTFFTVGDTRVYTGTLVFDDPAFPQPLDGPQVIIATATNVNDAVSTAEQNFVVDNQGPTITVNSQQPGDLIGGILQLSVDVTDTAGVLDSSVRCVIGNNLNSQTVFLTRTPGTSTFTGQYDTAQASKVEVLPLMSWRASDKLGNEGSVDFTARLDTGPPIVQVQPSALVGQIAQEVDAGFECSYTFPLMGVAANTDLDTVFQFSWPRVRIWDQGQIPAQGGRIPISGIDTSSVKLYMLRDNSKPLVVNTVGVNGPGGEKWCDSINPEVIPSGSNPQPGQAIAVDMAPLMPRNVADYQPGAAPFFSAICMEGSDEEAPEPVCTLGDGTVTVLGTPIDPLFSEPSVYVIPPVTGSSSGCMGLRFDYLANNVEDGWICVAAVAADNLGNRGISTPSRIWVDKNGDGLDKDGNAKAAVTPPDCVGSQDPTTGVVDPNDNCVYRPPTQSLHYCQSDTECGSWGDTCTGSGGNYGVCEQTCTDPSDCPSGRTCFRNRCRRNDFPQQWYPGGIEGWIVLE